MGRAAINRHEEAKADFGSLSPSLCVSFSAILLLFCPALPFMTSPAWECEGACPSAHRLGRVKAMVSKGGSWWGPGWLLELGTEVVWSNTCLKVLVPTAKSPSLTQVPVLKVLPRVSGTWPPRRRVEAGVPVRQTYSLTNPRQNEVCSPKKQITGVF